MGPEQTGKGRPDRQPGAPRGAARVQRPLREQLESYLAHHRKTARESARRLFRAPLASAMTWSVMGIAMALPVCLMLLLQSLYSVSDGWDQATRISVYLKLEAGESDALKLRDELRAREDVASVRFLPRDTALDQFRERSGLGEVLDYLQENPLPHTLIVSPAPAVQSPPQLKALTAQLSRQPGVERVQLDLAWLQRLAAIADLIERAVAALALLLGVALILVVGNTIRLAIENRREEILVAKMVGGTDGFVRRPFLYTGAWYGLGGALLAWLLVELALWWLNGPVERLASPYGGGFALEGLSPGAWLLLVLVGTGLGWTGAWLAVKRHLAQIEPR